MARAPNSAFVEGLLALSNEQRADFIRQLAPAKRESLRYLWRLWARDTQWWEPDEYTFTVALAGRGFGKTRMGAETTIRVARQPRLCSGWIGLAGRTWGDLEGTMIEGDDGIMACSPPGFRPRYIAHKHLLIWPNGVRARCINGEEPATARGPNLGFVWADELAHWACLSGDQGTWQLLKLALRKGDHPRALVTTTPLGLPEIEELVWEHNDHGEPVVATEDDPPDRVLDGFRVNAATRVISGSTYDNAANLSPKYFEDVVRLYERTASADQELRGKIARGNPRSPFRVGWFRRVDVLPEAPERVAIVVDPSGKLSGNSSEVGIVVVCSGQSGALYLLADLSGPYTPPEYAAIIAQALQRWQCTTVVVEDNFGGDQVEITIRSEMPDDLSALTMVHRVTATVFKGKRAALAAPAWSSGRVYHVGSPRQFVRLERQMAAFDPSRPVRSQETDRMDAIVWAVLWYLGDGTDRTAVAALSSAEAWEAIYREIAERRDAG